MACLVCGNKVGFALGTCIRCGFNEISGDYKFIEVNTDILKAYLPSDVYIALVNAHEENFKEKKI